MTPKKSFDTELRDIPLGKLAAIIIRLNKYDFRYIRKFVMYLHRERRKDERTKVA